MADVHATLHKVIYCLDWHVSAGDCVGRRLWLQVWPISYQENDRIEISYDVIFDESIILNNEASTLSNIADDEYIIDIIIGERIVNNEKEYLIKWLGYDKDTWEPISHVINNEALIDWNDRSHQYALLTKYISIDDVDPENYQDALSCPEALFWQQAITSELNSLKDNDM